MKMFDFLIDKNNKIPNPDMEYIYRFDMIWNPDILETKSIKIGTIVTNVKQQPNKSYHFIIKDTGELCCTNYAWSLAENTPENIERIEKYELENEIFEEHKVYIDTLRDNIITL